MQLHPLRNFLGKIWAKFGQILAKVIKILVKSKNKILNPKNIGSPAVMALFTSSEK